MKIEQMLQRNGVTLEGLMGLIGDVVLSAREESRHALFAYKSTQSGEIDEERLIFVFENYDAAQETLRKLIKSNTDEDLYFDIETMSESEAVALLEADPGDEDDPNEDDDEELDG